MVKEQLIEILLELRSASLQLGDNPSESDIRALIDKYNMLFIGKEINTIYSDELCRTINNYFHLETNNEELNKLLPDICKSLNMECEPMIEVSKLGKTSKPDHYQVTLW